jgi:PAS domain S-box-containing protein
MTDARKAGFMKDTKLPEDVEGLKHRLEAYEGRFQTQNSRISVLEHERQKFSAIVKHTDAGVILLDATSHVVWANEAYRKGFVPEGSPQRDPLGLSCHDALCRKQKPCKECPTASVFKSGRVAHHEVTLFIDGRHRPIYVTATPVIYLDGQVDQVMVMLQDLSNLAVLRQSEEALRSSEQRFRSVFEQTGAGMITTKTDGSLLQVTTSVCTMLGYTETELLRMRLTDLIHPDDLAGIIAQLDEGRTGSKPAHEMEYQLVRRDKTPVWCQITTVWQYAKNRKPKYCIALVQNISERKRAEKALGQSRKRYQALVHSIDGIVWEADTRASRFLFVSKQAERILGFPVERWMAQPRFWRNHIHPEDLEDALSALSEAVRQGRGHELEYRMLAADGRTVWIRDTVSLVRENQRVTKLRGLMVDITEKKMAEEALRHKEEQLRQSQKMEAIGRLAGGIAHDFNNLLTAITGYGDLLLKGLGDENPLRREANEISKAAQRAADLTGQLLAFSRQQVLQPRVLDLNDVIEDMETMLRRLIGEHIQFETRLDGGMGAIKADPGQMHQVLLNLVVNARDAMSSGGKLIIETCDVDLDEPYAARHPGVVPGTYVRLAVGDTGRGMDEDTKARLFEPFFTTKEQGKGTGLGLSTVYGIVKQSGGHISVESTPDTGTKFQIHFPRVEKELLESQPEKDAPIPETSPGTEKILLVEDDDSVRELAREILEMNGYDVVEAGDGVEALHVFEAQEGTIDLLVTDLVMPKMGGRDLAQELAPKSPDLKVLYLSGYTDSVVLQQGMLDPGSYFLQKPFTPSRLAHRTGGPPRGSPQSRLW